jgi:hypothetical protein
LENTDKCHSQKTLEQVPVQVAKDINVLPQIFEREAAFQWRLDGEDDDGNLRRDVGQPTMQLQSVKHN